ncbi:MAG: Rrf2 family transcriptional regulator [Pseudobdellovibrionaceae bacterium]
MMKFNRKIEYALMALKHMSRKRPGELTAAKEVSDTYHSPFDATAKVMQIMASRGILKAEQGVMGGYQITKDLSRVSFYELSEIILGPTAIVKCLHKDEVCEIQNTCNIVSPLSVLNSKIKDFYLKLSLRELVEAQPTLSTLKDSKIGSAISAASLEKHYFDGEERP